MRIAVCGKGGSGKSTIAGSLARELARRGHKVVAIDADPNPNLGISLGVGAGEVEAMTPILNALLDAGHTHDDPTPAAEDLLARFGVDAPEGIRLVATGKIERPSDACLCCGSHNTTRQFFGELPADDRTVVADLEAGLNDLVWADPDPDDVVVVLTEGSVKSVHVARGAVEVARLLGVRRVVAVANRAQHEGEAGELAAELGVDEAVTVPDDPAVEAADRVGVAPMDHDPSSPAMGAVVRLADLLAG